MGIACVDLQIANCETDQISLLIFIDCLYYQYALMSNKNVYGLLTTKNFDELLTVH